MGYTIVANWKMNGDIDFFNNYLNHFESYTPPQNTSVIIAPQAPLLSQNGCAIVKLAAQNMSQHASGAYTGEINAELLESMGIKYTILGHSERRQYFYEENREIQEKAIQAINHGIKPIICIGESLKAYESEQTYRVLEKQILEAIPKTAKAEEFLIAYEPLWAIGTGKTPTISEIEAIHRFIAEKAKKHGAVSILYGGSVKPSNTQEILKQPHVHGVLVGGASLKPDDFMAIISSVPN